jgi:2-polyprenyl-3-methyl-5-hydroxy-6-metoxy-1,4-benzoquinol methylase
VRTYLNVIINTVTRGRDGQSFLGASWIGGLLRLAPARYKRQLALMVLSWSPHYFFRSIDPDYLHMSHSKYVEKEFERNRSTRERLCSEVLLSRLSSGQVVLDYGCGPGFLASSVSRHVRKVYGIDLSKGVLECARILNGPPNVTYLDTTQLSMIEDCSVDLVYSIAVVQHVTDEVFKKIMTDVHGKLREGGEVAIHVILDEDNWKSEQDWIRDTSLKGRMKWNYGLHCFARTEDGVRELLESADFASIEIRPMKELCPVRFDDVCAQHLIRAVKRTAGAIPSRNSAPGH